MNWGDEVTILGLIFLFLSFSFLSSTREICLEKSALDRYLPSGWVWSWQILGSDDGYTNSYFAL